MASVSVIGRMERDIKRCGCEMSRLFSILEVKENEYIHYYKPYPWLTETAKRRAELYDILDEIDAWRYREYDIREELEAEQLWQTKLEAELRATLESLKQQQQAWARKQVVEAEKRQTKATSEAEKEGKEEAKESATKGMDEFNEMKERELTLGAIRYLFVVEAYNNGYTYFLKGLGNLFEEEMVADLVLSQNEVAIDEFEVSDYRWMLNSKGEFTIANKRVEDFTEDNFMVPLPVILLLGEMKVKLLQANLPFKVLAKKSYGVSVAGRAKEGICTLFYVHDPIWVGENENIEFSNQWTDKIVIEVGKKITEKLEWVLWLLVYGIQSCVCVKVIGVVFKRLRKEDILLVIKVQLWWVCHKRRVGGDHKTSSFCEPKTRVRLQQAIIDELLGKIETGIPELHRLEGRIERCGREQRRLFKQLEEKQKEFYNHSPWWPEAIKCKEEFYVIMDGVDVWRRREYELKDELEVKQQVQAKLEEERTAATKRQEQKLQAAIAAAKMKEQREMEKLFAQDEVLCDIQELLSAEPCNNGYENFLEGFSQLVEEETTKTTDKSELPIVVVIKVLDEMPEGVATYCWMLVHNVERLNAQDVFFESNNGQSKMGMCIFALSLYFMTYGPRLPPDKFHFSYGIKAGEEGLISKWGLASYTYVKHNGICLNVIARSDDVEFTVRVGQLRHALSLMVVKTLTKGGIQTTIELMGESKRELISDHFVVLQSLPKFSHWVLNVTFITDSETCSVEEDSCNCLVMGCGDNRVYLWGVSNSADVLKVCSLDWCLPYSMWLWGHSLESLRVASDIIYNEIIVWRVVSKNGSLLPTSPSEDHSDWRSTFSNNIKFQSQQYVAVHMCKLVGHEGSIFRLAWSSEGCKLVSVSDDRSARIWAVEAEKSNSHNLEENVDSGSLAPVLVGHNARVWDCCIFYSLIVTAGEDCTCRVWEVDGKQLKLIKEHIGRGIWRCSYDPTSSLLVTAEFNSEEIRSLDLMKLGWMFKKVAEQEVGDCEADNCTFPGCILKHKLSPPKNVVYSGWKMTESWLEITVDLEQKNWKLDKMDTNYCTGNAIELILVPDNNRKATRFKVRRQWFFSLGQGMKGMRYELNFDKLLGYHEFPRIANLEVQMEGSNSTIQLQLSSTCLAGSLRVFQLTIFYWAGRGVRWRSKLKQEFMIKLPMSFRNGQQQSKLEDKLVLRREVCHDFKYYPRKQWGRATPFWEGRKQKQYDDVWVKKPEHVLSCQGVFVWVETVSFQDSSSTTCVVLFQLAHRERVAEREFVPRIARP